MDEFSRCISLEPRGAAPSSADTEASTGESCFTTHYVLIRWVLTLLNSISLSVRLQNYLVITCYLFRLILEGHSFHSVAVHVRCVQLGGESGFELNCFPLPKLREQVGNLLFPGTIVRFCCNVHTAVSLQASKINENLFTPFKALVHFWKRICYSMAVTCPKNWVKNVRF